METIKDGNGEKITVYADRIDEEIHAFYARFAGEKVASDPAAFEKFITDSPQTRWTACMMHCARTVFHDRKALKDSTPKFKTDKPHGFKLYSKNTEYDVDIINNIADIYINYCTLYDKAINVNGFTKLLGMSDDRFYKWLNGDDNGDEVTRKRKLLAQKIIAENEKSLSEILTTGKRNPVAVLGVLNHYHGWNMPHVSREIAQKPARSVEELPSFGNMHNALPDSRQGETSENAVK